jgi:hypothetical protein
MPIVLIIAGVLCVLGAVTSFIFLGKHPEALGSPSPSRQGEVAGGESTTGAVRQRPAGPGAENMSAERPGGFVPPAEPPA